MSSKKKLPVHKLSADRIPAVEVFRANVRALLDAGARGPHPVTQVAIAHKSGIPLRTLTHQLSRSAEGASAPTLRTVQAVADAFGVDPSWLLLPDLPSQLALDPQFQQGAKRAFSSYLKEADFRAAVDKTAALLPPAP